MSARLRELAEQMLDAYFTWNDRGEGGEDDLHYVAKMLRMELSESDKPSAPAIIELTNNYSDNGTHTYIFYQGGGDALLNAKLVNQPGTDVTLGKLLQYEMIDEMECYTLGSRVEELLRRTLAADRIEDLLKWVERLYMRDLPKGADADDTVHGEWIYKRYELTK